MNPVLKLLLDALMNYVKTHPDEVEKLIEMIVKAIINHSTSVDVSSLTSNGLNQLLNKS